MTGRTYFKAMHLARDCPDYDACGLFRRSTFFKVSFQITFLLDRKTRGTTSNSN